MESEDPEMEAFADKEMDAQMKRMAAGAPGGMPDSEEEDVSLDMDQEDGSEAGFFSGEDDLQDVELEGGDDDDEDEDDDDEGENLMSDGSEGGLDEEDESEVEAEEGSDLPEEEQSGKKKKAGRAEKNFGVKNMKKTNAGTSYASYEEFAHLLDEGLDAEEKPKGLKKHNLASPNYSMQKKKRTK